MLPAEAVVGLAVHAAETGLLVQPARGVVFEQPPHRVARLPHADLWMGFFRDMDRNLLAIMSEVPPA